MYLPTMSPSERERYDYAQGNLGSGVHGFSLETIEENIELTDTMYQSSKYFSPSELETYFDDHDELAVKHDKLTEYLEEITQLFEKHTGKVTKDMFADIAITFRKLVDHDFSRDVCVSEIENILSK